jgi:hypothetical protein
MRALARRLLAGWQEIAGRFGEVQTLVILCLFYALLIGPASMIGAVGRRDLLHKRGLHAAESAWNDADTSKPELERVKHQF